MNTSFRAKALDIVARTATVASPQYNLFGRRTAIIFLNVTAASGTGGLTLQLRGYDGFGNVANFFAASAAVTATGTFVYVVSAATLTAAAGVTQVAQMAVPQFVDIQVSHGDSSSYTYSVSAEFTF